MVNDKTKLALERNTDLVLIRLTIKTKLALERNTDLALNMVNDKNKACFVRIFLRQ